MKRFLTIPNFLVIITIALGAIFRFYKLDWGEGYYFHPDEYHIVGAVERISFPDALNPKLFSYGSLTVYLIALLKSLVSPQISTFIVGRGLAAFFSSLTLVVVYKLARELFEKKIHALYVLISVAFMPGLIQQAHFTTPESFLIFWCTLALYLLLVWVRNRRATLLLLSAAAAGLALGTKFLALIQLPLYPLAFLATHTKHSVSAFFKSALNSVLVFLIILATAVSVFPYSILDSDSYLHSMRYETGVGRGDPLVFYTRQFIDTPPFIFQFTKILPYALGGGVIVFGIVGIFLTFFFVKSLSKTKRIQWFLFATSFLLFFVSNSVLFAKWTRFIAPSFLYFSFFAVAGIAYIETRFKDIAIVLQGVFLTLSTLSLVMFMSIYTSPDVRIKATKWFNTTQPQGSSVFTEAGNMLEVPLTGNHEVIAFDFYDLEHNVYKKSQLYQGLSDADYFIVQSRRIFSNHQRLPEDYPYTSHFYEALFSGQLGFEKIATFTSYPRVTLFEASFEIPDENAEETWSVFDHPVVQIYKRKVLLSSDDYETILTHY